MAEFVPVFVLLLDMVVIGMYQSTCINIIMSKHKCESSVYADIRVVYSLEYV